MVVRKLTGICNARGSFSGELANALGKILGRTHCGLCDVTHGLRFRERPDWRWQKALLPVPFDVVHIARSPELVAVCPEAPCIAAETELGLVSLLSPDEIDACQGQPAALLAAVQDAVRVRTLQLPPSEAA
ncbi:MAG: hypothetical protein H0U03_02550 [Actinobacteria bacterium]|nr:hypothetical protein [Actinomycetota bacterium]